jgi:hypothetical protein
MTGPMAGGLVKVKLWAGYLTGIMVPYGGDVGWSELEIGGRVD